MLDRSKIRLREAALLVAEHTHQNDGSIAPIIARKKLIDKEVEERMAAYRNIQRDRTSIKIELENALIQFIPEELR